jgi:hypothetical protein
MSFSNLVNNACCRRRRSFTLAALLLIALVGQAASAGERLEKQLLEAAPQVLKNLRAKGYHTIGVLKFRVCVKPGPIRDNRGTLNLLMAKRLETALALANPNTSGQSVRLVRDASSVAATIPGASHLSAKGRRLLLSRPYPPSWGDESVHVDAFVTGVVSLEPNLRTMQVAIFGFGTNDPDLAPMAALFYADTDGIILNEVGESFSLRSVDVGVGQTDPADDAARVRAKPEEAFPFRNRPAVVLKVLYDGKPINVEFRNGEALIPEPNQGQEVMLVLERVDQCADRLAAVVKVNGENTLYRERIPDVDCSKWILNPGCQPLTIRGFQKEKQSAADRFRVASHKQSAQAEMDYGADVGLISMTVFRELRTPAPPSLAENAEDLAAIAKAVFPSKPPKDGDALKSQIRTLARTSTTRGVILSDGVISAPIELMTFEVDPANIMSAVLRYYQPQSK